MKILVVGGLGYIGSHMVHALLKANYEPIVLDNVSTGNKRLLLDTPFYQGNMQDTQLLKRIFTENNIEAVMHFAAFSQVAESVADPAKYYKNNVSATLVLLEVMLEYNVNTMIFSSSAAIFGEPIYMPIDEAHPKNPMNPYGKSKLMVENLLEDFAIAKGLKYACLRYFNAAGAEPNGLLGECHEPETHLIPICLQVATGKRTDLQVYGMDYETKDGTCIRDYIHVCDIANAHLLALEYLLNKRQSLKLNLGSGSGHTVKEVIDTIEKVTGKSISYRVLPRRLGDPKILVADSSAIKSALGWQAQYPDLFDIISHAWNWEKILLNQESLIKSGNA